MQLTQRRSSAPGPFTAMNITAVVSWVCCLIWDGTRLFHVHWNKFKEPENCNPHHSVRTNSPIGALILNLQGTLKLHPRRDHLQYNHILELQLLFAVYKYFCFRLKFYPTRLQ